MGGGGRGGTGEGGGSYTARPSREEPETGPTRDHDDEEVERSGTPEHLRREADRGAEAGEADGG